MQSFRNPTNRSRLDQHSAIRFAVVCALFLTLVACGGSGGSSISEPAPTPETEETTPPPVTTSSNGNDDDSDSDGVANGVDNCPQQANANQANADDDGSGDVCDDDDDNDLVADASDNCPFTPNSNQENTDNDNQGNACDADDDNDNINDVSDNCPLSPNSNQENSDNDNQGNICDADDDNDGIDDLSDNCPNIANADQADIDNDDIGDACDGVVGNNPPQVIRLEQFRSNLTGDPLLLQMYLPENYNANQSYPVMYVLDDIAPRVAVHVNADKKQAILVMVNGWDRNRDFTSVGAETAIRVLIDEVLPLIESQYPIDTSRRTLTGWSLSGLFAGLVMLLEDPNDRKFQTYVALDGSFWSNPSFTNNLISQLASVTNTVPATIYLSGAGSDGNDSVVQNFRDSLQAQNFNQLTINYQRYPFAGHGGTIDPYMAIVVDELYGE